MDAPPTKSCPMQTRCPLYPLFLLQSNLKLWQERYCESDYKSCARFLLARSGEPVPTLLLPSGTLMKKVKEP